MQGWGGGGGYIAKEKKRKKNVHGTARDESCQKTARHVESTVVYGLFTACTLFWLKSLARFARKCRVPPLHSEERIRGGGERKGKGKKAQENGVRALQGTSWEGRAELGDAGGERVNWGKKNRQVFVLSCPRQIQWSIVQYSTGPRKYHT